MDAPGLKRRLTCILAADAVGYSRHVSEDEERALRILAAHRAVIDGIIAFHDGRIFNTAGDSVVAEFHSVVDAVRCAVEMQDALKTRNEALPEAQRMQFRVGINLGEVVVKGDDLLGDGVNVAARLESVAPPGGVVVSSSVYDQITGKLDLGFLDIGEQALKNITRPIRAYRIDGAGATVRPGPGSAPAALPVATPAGSKRPIVVTAIVLAAIALGLAFATGLIRPPDDDDERAADRARLATAEQARADAEKRAADASLREAKARVEADAAALQAAAEREAAAVRAKAEADAAAIRARAATEAKGAKQAAASAPASRPQPSGSPSAAPAAAPAAMPAPAPAAAAPALASAPVTATASPAPSPASPWDGRWTAQQRCEAVARNAPFSRERDIEVRGGEFVFEHGPAGQPGHASARGRPDASGTLVLVGSGTSPLPQSYGKVFDIRYEGRYEADRFVLLGTLGERRCRLVLARAR